MPPKRRVSGPATKSQQSTLAFHGGGNKVTKTGARAQDTKKDLQSKSATKAIKREADVAADRLEEQADAIRRQAADRADAVSAQQR